MLLFFARLLARAACLRRRRNRRRRRLLRPAPRALLALGVARAPPSRPALGARVERLDAVQVHHPDAHEGVGDARAQQLVVVHGEVF